MPAGFGVKWIVVPIETKGKGYGETRVSSRSAWGEEMSEEISHALYEAGCTDGTPFSSEGVAAVGFMREADSLESAIRSAITDGQKAGFSVQRVESPDESVFSRINKGLAQQ